MIINQETIEKYEGECLKLEMVDGSIFEGVLCFVEYDDEIEGKVFRIGLDVHVPFFLTEDIIKIELIG